jgi:hypothetical protein
VLVNARRSAKEKRKSAAVNPLNGLRARVNKSLNLRMAWIALPLLLAATAPPPKTPVAQTQVVATVQIVAGEEIRFNDIGTVGPKSTFRQSRVRNGMPMVEFY